MTKKKNREGDNINKRCSPLWRLGLCECRDKPLKFMFLSLLRANAAARRFALSLVLPMAHGNFVPAIVYLKK